MQKSFSFVDIFAAPGGLSSGFEMAGFRVLAGVDIDRDGLKHFLIIFLMPVYCAETCNH